MVRDLFKTVGLEWFYFSVDDVWSKNILFQLFSCQNILLSIIVFFQEMHHWTVLCPVSETSSTSLYRCSTWRDLHTPSPCSNPKSTLWRYQYWELQRVSFSYLRISTWSIYLFLAKAKNLKILGIFKSTGESMQIGFTRTLGTNIQFSKLSETSYR